MTVAHESPDAVVAHLTPKHWEQANRQLIRKALAEFAHERLITPTGGADGRYVVAADNGAVEYHFVAELFALNHWQIDADSITKTDTSVEVPLDALALFVELRDSLQLTDEVLPVYLEEITSTLASTAYKLAKPPTSAQQLARAGFQDIEVGMTEGHPCFVANNGRIGFGAADYRTYAPEAGVPIRLLWVAARRDRSTFTSAADLNYEQLLATELSAAERDRFDDALRTRGLDAAEYQLIPVHPWQWEHKLAVTFAGEVARRNLVCVGYGDDEYLPQQSIRTFFNVSDPTKHYVKTALSVLNMGFLRGLSAAYMEATPAINDWLGALIDNDDTLKQTGFAILCERAAMGYHHQHFEAAVPKGSPYLKMFAALWRESPVPSLAPNQRLATMASLLHVDHNGHSFVAALIGESGLHPADWLRRYLDAYLRPLVHCFYAYGLVYMPHGENVILVLEDGIPQRAFFKDIAEEIGVMDDDLPLPGPVERIRFSVPDELRTLSIFTDVFDCFFRFLNGILAGAGLLTEAEFWATVAATITDYVDSVPHLSDRIKRYDLFADRFSLSCLNRLQLRNNRQMVNLLDPNPADALQLAGTLDNPLAASRVSGPPPR